MEAPHGDDSTRSDKAAGLARPGPNRENVLAGSAFALIGDEVSCIQLGQWRSIMKVKDAMHKGVDWVGPDTPVIELAKLMREHDIGAVPIGENDQLIGMVTDRDIVCKGLAAGEFDGEITSARDIMTQGIHCCREDDDLAKAVH